MLHRIKKLLMLRLTPRDTAARRSPIRRRLFERLEDRALLSATIRPKSVGGMDYSVDPSGNVPDHVSKGADAAHPPLAGMPAYFDHGGYVGPWASYQQPGDVPNTWRGESRVPAVTSSNWEQKSPITAHGRLASGAGAASQRAVYVVYVMGRFYFVDLVGIAPGTSPSPGGWQSAPPVVAAVRTPVHVATAPPHAADFADLYTTLDSTSYAAVLPLSNAAAPFTLRKTDPTSLLRDTALDAAFRSYAPSLLLMSTGGSIGRTDSPSVDEQPAPSEDAVDGFLPTSELTSPELEVAADEVISRERTTIDELLHRLVDLGPIPAADAPQQANQDPKRPRASDSDPAGTTQPRFSEVALAEAEGGMVVLETADGVSEPALDWSRVAGAAIDSALRPIAAVEAALGFYQAVDTGGDDFSAALNSPVGAPASAAVPPGNSQKRASIDVERATSGKSAAAVGASALIGALVWSAWQTQAERRPQDGIRRQQAR